MTNNRKNHSIDHMDIRILKQLQRDASMTVAEIAEAVDMSATPCWRRIKRMRDQGIIKSTVAILDAALLDLDFTAYAVVKLAVPSNENMQKFESLLMRWPEVTACHRVTGAVDYIIKVVTKDMHAYDDFLRKRILESVLVSDVQSRIVLSTLKDSPTLPLVE
ncbi:MAG: Lrp/AsnC family transcriptional regulator [Fimbriimonadaceae bacterium]|nr:Lrp/AsnC family transcriptional regulator [Alphaproteobacteria bacterium]